MWKKNKCLGEVQRESKSLLFVPWLSEIQFGLMRCPIKSRIQFLNKKGDQKKFSNLYILLGPSPEYICDFLYYKQCKERVKSGGEQCRDATDVKTSEKKREEERKAGTYSY